MPTTMRRLVNLIGALTALTLVVGVLYFTNDQVRDRQSILAVATDVQRFRQALTTRAAYNGSDLNQRGWPPTIDPAWFTSDPPRNMLVTPDRPWVEIATPEEAPLKDPPVRMTINTGLASFWYNPYQGIIRARVPVAISDRRALEVYNAVNGTSLDSIYAPPAPAAPASADHAPPTEPAPHASAEPVQVPMLDPNRSRR